MKVMVRAKKTNGKVNVVKAAQQETTQQKSPSSEFLRKEGPG
jgi:hypothetical protein